ncbi:hypothetical protein L1080_034375 [Rhodococcus sp. MSC1_016]|jgi:hypothetical protein|uniref:hypothetical protein n=1 Tax=Rhodococcus sp. MSC1_016 TaxID=2909266 RepID=UPI00202F67F1|nr:hypothetical protein [Rhodococcus sp. MSC1_016]
MEAAHTNPSGEIRSGQPARHATGNADQPADIVDLRRYRRWRRRRRDLGVTWEQARRLGTEAEDILQFARTWAPYGGAPAEETFVRFGMMSSRFVERLRQIILDSGIDPTVARQLAEVYQMDLPSPYTSQPGIQRPSS